MSRAAANFIKCFCSRTRHIVPDRNRLRFNTENIMHADAISAIGLKQINGCVATFAPFRILPTNPAHDYQFTVNSRLIYCQSNRSSHTWKMDAFVPFDCARYFLIFAGEKRVCAKQCKVWCTLCAWRARRDLSETLGNQKLKENKSIYSKGKLRENQKWIPAYSCLRLEREKYSIDGELINLQIRFSRVIEKSVTFAVRIELRRRHHCFFRMPWLLFSTSSVVLRS